MDRDLVKRSLWALLLTLTVFVGISVARSTGPDISTATNRDNVCNAMRPNPLSPHGSGTAGDGDYRLEIDPPMTETAEGFNFTPDTEYDIRLVGTTPSATIRGFLVQARTPGDTPTLGMAPMLLGSFQPGTGQQNYDCDGAGAADMATITHSTRQNDVASVELSWTSPSVGGVVDFYYTVVRTLTTHYDGIRARDVGVLTPPPPTNASTDATGHAMEMASTSAGIVICTCLLSLLV